MLAPTGKAASRVDELTGRKASTIHRWLYQPVERQDGKVEFELKELDKIPLPGSRLLIVDEASMIGSDIWSDLRSTCKQLGVSILLVGDGFQLPPVSAPGSVPFSVFDEGFCAKANTVELRQIHRQALDSPIVRATLAIREGDIADAMYELDVLDDEDELDKQLKDGQDGMVIVWRNSTRHVMNSKVRRLRGLPADDINIGEPMLVLRNNYKLEVYNGEIYPFRGWTEKLGEQEFRAKITEKDEQVEKYLKMNFGTTPMLAEFAIVAMEVLRGYHDTMSPHWPEKAVNWWMRNGRGSYCHVNWGYTLTCHKSQGSEADNVLVGLESGQNLTNAEGRRWIYTALSRAKKKATIAYIPKDAKR